MYTVSIDAGGTMTDAIIAGKGDLLTLKVDSTPHDLTVSLMNCLSEASEKLGYQKVRDFLGDVSLIRWSSTVTSNVLGELRGAKIGLIVDQGFETSLYGEGPSPAVGTIIAPENIFGLRRDVDASELLDAVKAMLRRGVRRICICLAGSYPDNGEELRLKAIINQQYPDHFVGSVPVVIGSEIAQTPDDLTRAHSALINAYIHPPLAASLFKAEDRLKDEAGWNGPLLIGHINGGMARVAKTKAIDTIESGPVFGFFGAGTFAKIYQIPAVLCLDVGGTTAKASVIKNGTPIFRRHGDLFGIPVRTPIALLRSCSVGGGSIARCNPDTKELRVGPESMGASPGPACYGLGGTSATVTDSFVTLGYIDPRMFHGGKRSLDRKLAEEAIERHVAKAMGLSVFDAAHAVVDAAVGDVAELTAHTAQEANLNVADSVLFATGGNGSLFAPFVAQRLAIPKVYLFFRLGPVFSAFGCSTSDIQHTYRKAMKLRLPSAASEGQIAEILMELHGRAKMDLEGEGFSPAKASYRAELEVQHGANPPISVAFDIADAAGGSLAAKIREAFTGETAGGEAVVELVTLNASFPTERFSPEKLDEAAAGSAVPTKRQIRLDEGMVEARVYDWTTFRVGQAPISGPAVITGGNITSVVPTGWTLTIDRYGNGVLSR